MSRNVFYEEEGDFKVGAVLADNKTSLQVEAPHGRRSKVKSSAVLLDFEEPPLAGFMSEARRVAGDIDVDFLWQCCGAGEFSYEGLAREYFGHAPAPVEAAGVLLRLHEAPMYFYKRGRGRYKAAPEEALKAALASVERKKAQALRKEGYVRQLAAGELPDEFQPVLKSLLYKPDKASLEWKALEEASAAARTTPARLLQRCGGLASEYDYHLSRFLFEHFPRGTEFPGTAAIQCPDDLPQAAVAAFSIDDATTTEIDDALSLEALADGGWRVGVHIAAPALGITPGSELDRIARERLSTVYHPGAKITMLPDAAIECFTLGELRHCPSLSLYLDVTPALEIVRVETRIEAIEIAANLRHDALECVFNEETAAAGAVDHACGSELHVLWRLASKLETERRGGERDVEQRPEYSFHVANDRVTIVPRRRGTPIDTVVSEFMIYANSEWARRLAAAETAAIYRVQSNSKVRMSTVPAGHSGLGVAQYVWATSPLRRYVDLVNQRQLIALVRGDTPPYRAGDEALLAAMRDFEVTYDAYGEFQRGMERYWCLRWLRQESRATVAGSVIRENLVRLSELPLVVRVPSLPALAPGSLVELAVENMDLLELTVHCEYRGELETGAVASPAATAVR
jgi:exoribonuclease-2